MVSAQILDVVPATEAHARFMIDNVYPTDREEILAHGVTVEFGVMFSFNHAGQVWAAVAEEGVVCMWGISKQASLLGGASAWLLTSTLIDKYARPFLKQAKPYIAELTKQYGYLENYVDARHERALRFFKWLGFSVEDNGMLIGPQRIPFYKICSRVGYGN